VTPISPSLILIGWRKRGSTLEKKERGKPFTVNRPDNGGKRGKASFSQSDWEKLRSCYCGQGKKKGKRLPLNRRTVWGVFINAFAKLHAWGKDFPGRGGFSLDPRGAPASLALWGGIFARFLNTTRGVLTAGENPFERSPSRSCNVFRLEEESQQPPGGKERSWLIGRRRGGELFCLLTGPSQSQ